ncbi:hypothetical protein ACFXPS_40680 [Nocardia sp. NPDC059091]|uniref:hypothetical protein n=1 Tax=unclassified Nocardia TaxID=2637762 RepID=UPI00367AE031
MTLKSLTGKGFAVAAAAAAASLAVAAAPASATITNLTADCVGGALSGGCAYVAVSANLTDSTPVSFTINGAVLAGSPFTPTPSSGGTYYVLLYLDCIGNPFHVVATQNSATGGPASQMAADYTVPSSIHTASTGSSAADAILGAVSSLLPRPACHVV